MTKYDVSCLVGLPPPSLSQSLNAKGRALRQKSKSDKEPLFASVLGTLEGTFIKTDPLPLRNFTLCATTYFFMPRGEKARPPLKNEVIRMEAVLAALKD